MSDPRVTPFNGRVAHTSLKGVVEAEVFTDGKVLQISPPLADVSDKPGGARQCQLLYGEAFCVLEEVETYVYGFRQSDGYVGWVHKMHLQEMPASGLTGETLHVVVPRAAFLRKPDIKSVQEGLYWGQLSFGSVVHHRPYADDIKEAKLEQQGWLCTMMPTNHIPEPRFLRRSHLSPQNAFFDDPAGIAELFIHTPYLWGGDSAFGIDCSGLVQRALMACGKSCPRDSDMQFTFFPQVERETLQRGDLVFWKGHVGMMLDADRLIHANAHHMAVASEPLDAALLRISRQEFGDVIGFGRP